MDNILPIYILNLLVMSGMFITTIYRAWVEKQDLKGKQKMEQLKAILEKERDTIRRLSGDEFIDMLETILEN